MISTTAVETGLVDPPLMSESTEREAITRLRLAAGVALLAEIILPVTEESAFSRPDLLTIDVQAIWFVFTVGLLAATWHPRFGRVWKPAILLFAASLILSAGILSVRGASLAPFMFLLVLLPVGGICLPWETPWQIAMNSLCIVLGSFFSIQFDRQNELVISGMSAMIASILGTHIVSVALTRQRTSIDAYIQALAGSEEKFRKIFETSSSLIAIYATPDGRIIDVNPAWEKTFAYSREEVIGRSLPDLGMVSDRDAFEQWTSSLKTGDTGIEQQPLALRRRRQEMVHCVYSWSTLDLNDKLCVLVVAQDVTARVQVEQELHRNREILLNQERLKAVGELASGIAHDLNNSLNAFGLRVELLRHDEMLSSRHHKSLELLARIVRDASATIGRLQDFARRRHDRPVENVDLGAIIHDSVEMARSTLEEKNSLSGRVTRVEVSLDALPPILGEPAELRQMFLNLLLNARDAMLMGGNIRIRGSFGSGLVVVTVEDEGQGISDELLGHVFDPFFTTKGERGTGLGLSIAYGVMTRLGGSITVANRFEGGAIFTLTFPISTDEPTISRQRHPTIIQRRRVMIIDDDLDNLDALKFLFESKGHSVKSATSGLKALEELIREDVAVDVVFCDLGMPNVNGWEVAARVKSLQSPPAFYLVTGWAQQISADEPRRCLVDGILAKPLDPDLLDRLLADVGHAA